jgi:hypothetical protein
MFTRVGTERELLILLQAGVAIYVPFLFQLCWGPLCGDPEKSPYPVVVPLLCLGVCRDVLSNAQPGPALSFIVVYSVCNVLLCLGSSSFLRS